MLKIWLLYGLERDNTQHRESTGGPKSRCARRNFSCSHVARATAGRRGTRSPHTCGFPISTEFYVRGADSSVPGVHLSDFCARAKCLFEGGEGKGRSAGAQWRYVFRSGRFRLFLSSRSLSLSSFITAKKKKKVFGSLVNFSRQRPLYNILNV